MKTSNDDSFLKNKGREFHTDGAEYAKLLCPNLLNLVTLGLRSFNENDLQFLVGWYSSISSER